ncbi:MAG: hypothetical protein IKK93_01110 [Campylobacter sp.]|nr:hypothetical protein [Campylobacter sp.]
MLTDKTLKVLLREDIQQFPKTKELYDLLINSSEETRKSVALNWLTNETNKNALSAELQNAITAGIIINTFNIDKAIQELSSEDETPIASNETNHLIIWPANPFLPGVGTKEAEAAEAIINQYKISSSKIFIYCPNNGESGMWGLSSVSQFGHHKSCKSNVLKGSQHNDDVITSPESLALTLLESYSNHSGETNISSQVQESILREDQENGQLTNAKINIIWSEPIYVHCNSLIAKDFQNLAQILQERGGTSQDANGNVIPNIKVEIKVDLPDNNQSINYGIQIYNDVCKYIDTGYKPGQQEQQPVENGESQNPNSHWTWEEVKGNKAAQQYITAVFTDIKSCKNRVLQKDGPAKKAKNICKNVKDEIIKQWGTFFGAAFKSVAQLSGYGFVANIIQKGLEELNKEKEDKNNDNFFKQFFNSKYSDTLKKCAGNIDDFIEWGE